MRTCYTDDVVLGSGHITCSIMIKKQKTNIDITRLHLMLGVSTIQSYVAYDVSPDVK